MKASIEVPIGKLGVLTSAAAAAAASSTKQRFTEGHVDQAG